MGAMHIVRFTKFWRHLSVEEMGEHAASLGYDGLDLVVREGHPIHPGNVSERLRSSVRTWSGDNIACAMITGETTLIDPAARDTRTLFHAAAHAGVPRIKIGYFVYQPGTDYPVTWDTARRALDGFANLARETEVQACYHTHGGYCLGSSAAGLRHLLEGFDPEHLGAYPDLGHLAVGGEEAPFGLAMLRDRLSAVAAKDARHVANPNPGHGPPYTDGFVPLGEGAGQIEAAVNLLGEWAFEGPLSVNTEYTSDPAVLGEVGGWDRSEEAARLRDRGEIEDLRYLREIFT